DFGEYVAGGLWDVVRRVVESEPRRQIIALALGEDLPVAVRVELVHHHPIQAGQRADLFGHHVAKLLQGGCLLEPAYGLLDQCVVVCFGSCVAAPDGLELDYSHPVNRVNGHVERRGVAMGREGSDVEGVAVARFPGQGLPEPGLALDSDGCRDRLAEQLLRAVSEQLAGVLARLEDREVGRPEHEQRPVGLDASRRLDGLGVAVGDSNAVTLDAIRLALPRGLLARGLVVAHETCTLWNHPRSLRKVAIAFSTIRSCVSRSTAKAVSAAPNSRHISPVRSPYPWKYLPPTSGVTP